MACIHARTVPFDEDAMACQLLELALVCSVQVTPASVEV
jgi:hypothetical protein